MSVLTTNPGESARLRSVQLAAGRPQRRVPLGHDLRRHLSHRGLASFERRDARRFGRGIARSDTSPAATTSALVVSDEVKLFAHTFGAAFLFVMVFIA